MLLLSYSGDWKGGIYILLASQWSHEVKHMQDIIPLSFMQITSLLIVWMMSSPLTGVIVSCGGLLGENLALMKVNWRTLERDTNMMWVSASLLWWSSGLKMLTPLGVPWKELLSHYKLQVSQVLMSNWGGNNSELICACLRMRNVHGGIPKVDIKEKLVWYCV